ncbi:2-amino-4-hydroxy-6-hydroxymethyldihydropteridine diphosphokinase [Orenia metallireducens]|jgi:2-amino-4-hydroxy-6-hydroxymethyldihydropteridine diphosphokinase|uniref:2-amino-4-hydroxy-6-hydroxymethyldihydropteridine diphosphokinase n=1 Tax=Orenia metallireducens TaxID=1413210 RepID=A0A285H9K6_9FIRM|nr:2-amino-4-hydroxy-6-hydroxymethyldihydropteridine diphosphokinase [Orenia metallireducens]PRX28901.1 2-amino-4-hydroxy-6-hydroxymethyldihydropteridine diphosphokinase [Orenia metallireducens]SNY32432.1 2-amino-4-hydroxy-6-hydroxymethyldihydropteridinediphosphokinase [Orenia metallireducens]
MNIVYLGLGTNLGDREENLKQAIDLIKDFSKTDLLEVSKVYETEPWGYNKQDSFLNLCLKLKTELSPQELLENCQSVEAKLKRKRLVKWGPRTIDVDILLYGDLDMQTDDLIIPHPRIAERAFVLIPLADLDESLVIDGKYIVDLIVGLGENGVEKYKNSVI